MKKGKFIHLGVYNEIKIGFGTVDCKDLKTIYVQLNSWIQPSDDNIEFEKLINKTRRRIKEKLVELNSDYFHPQSIVDLDIKTNGIKKGKKSFMDLEITLYVKKKFDVKSKEIKELVKTTSENIIDNILINDSIYNFSEKKI